MSRHPAAPRLPLAPRRGGMRPPDRPRPRPPRPPPSVSAPSEPRRQATRVEASWGDRPRQAPRRVPPRQLRRDAPQGRRRDREGRHDPGRARPVRGARRHPPADQEHHGRGPQGLPRPPDHPGRLRPRRATRSSRPSTSRGRGVNYQIAHDKPGTPGHRQAEGPSPTVHQGDGDPPDPLRRDRGRPEVRDLGRGPRQGLPPLRRGRPGEARPALVRA